MLHNNYACLQALVNNTLTWQSSCVIANNALKTAKLFVQGYNLNVHDVRCNKVHVKTVIISRASWFYLCQCDVISRSGNRLSSPLKVRFTPC